MDKRSAKLIALKIAHAAVTKELLNASDMTVEILGEIGVSEDFQAWEKVDDELNTIMVNLQKRITRLEATEDESE